MLRPSEIASMQAVYTKFFSSSLVLKRPALSSDGAGGFSTVSSVVGTYACHIEPDIRSNNNGETFLGRSVYLPQTYIIALDYQADVQKGDILSCTSEGDLEVLEIQEFGSIHLANRVVGVKKDT